MGPRLVDEAALFYKFSLERHVPVPLSRCSPPEHSTAPQLTHVPTAERPAILRRIVPHMDGYPSMWGKIVYAPSLDGLDPPAGVFNTSHQKPTFRSAAVLTLRTR